MSEPSPTPNPAMPDDAPPKPPSELVENSSFLRQALHEPWFLTCVILFGLIVVAAGIGLPKMWLSTPEGFDPKIRVSLLDRQQARSLARSAEELIAAGKFGEGIHTWRSAIANDPGNPAYSRGLLRGVLASQDGSRRMLGMAVSQGLWLLRITGTNLTDASLFGQMCERYELDEMLVTLLSPREPELNAEQVMVLLRSLYRLNRMAEFGGVWERHGRTLPADPDLAVYVAGWSVGWGPPAGISEGRARLDAALKRPETAVLAHMVSLPLAISRSDPEGYQNSLTFLVDHHADLPMHHARHWALLVSAGRTEDARNAARRFSVAPRTPHELQVMAAAMRGLGLPEDSLALVTKHRPKFSYFSPLWVMNAELLMEAGQWNEVRALGVDIRSDEQQRVSMPGYGWFLEGLGALKLNLPDQAADSFEQATQAHISDPLIGFRCAQQLRALGFAMHATKLLNGLERSFGGEYEYWFQLGVAAYEAGEYPLMLQACEKAYRLSPPDSINVANNYAAALLLLRREPGLASELTLRCLAAAPNRTDFRVNRLLALVLTQRYDAARELARTFNAETMTAQEASLVHLARFEIAASSGQTVEARAEADRIERRFLRAEQLTYFQGAMERLAAN
jgi:tetratricopeptide (TPR) repeat protein